MMFPATMGSTDILKITRFQQLNLFPTSGDIGGRHFSVRSVMNFNANHGKNYGNVISTMCANEIRICQRRISFKSIHPNVIILGLLKEEEFILYTIELLPYV
jgi:hypothetical protein